MTKLRHAAISVLFACCVLYLVGCGQKGPLKRVPAVAEYEKTAHEPATDKP